MRLAPKRTPSFRDLTPAECEAMLTRHHVGRLAYTFHDRVDVEPIAYVFAKRALVFRTAPGSKLETLAHHPWVALEIDEVKGLFDWRSVVVHGTVYALRDTGDDSQRSTYRAAVRSLRRLVPNTLREGDPVPFRSVVMRLHLDRVTGRAAWSGGKRSWKGDGDVEALPGTDPSGRRGARVRHRESRRGVDGPRSRLG
jgi:nitroimidazol reductase NimA-like FMN-containing flavoprotein (pyridoxamine 5'-phosphate oxidase superfamily)